MCQYQMHPQYPYYDTCIYKGCQQINVQIHFYLWNKVNKMPSVNHLILWYDNGFIMKLKKIYIFFDTPVFPIRRSIPAMILTASVSG